MKLCYALVLVVLSVGGACAEPPTNDKDNKVDEAALLNSVRDSGAVFTAQIGEVKPLAQTNSIPPSTSGEITFKEVKALRGKADAKKFNYAHREGMKNMDLETKGSVIVVTKATGVTAIVPATEANLAVVRKAIEKDDKK